MTDAPLAYDVGVHNGDDTGYYLHLGYRVVAVEANPAWAQRVRERFGDEVAEGRLEVLNVAVGPEPGEVDFHVSEQNDAWASLETDIPSRGGSYRTIRVPARRFEDILAEHGVPEHLKVDIEGFDRLCLEGLGPETRPRFVSVEMDHATGDRDIALLAGLGYDRFACIRQNDFAAIRPESVRRLVELRRRRGPLRTFLVRAVRRVRRMLLPPRDGDWRFGHGASGPTGPRLPAEAWMSADEALEVWRALHKADGDLGAGGVGEWFDMHARLPEPG